MTRLRTVAPLLSVLTTPVPSARWLSDDGAFRIVQNPRLGLPLVPFPVLMTEFDPPFHDVFQWRLVGDARGHDVDGTAWLVLRVLDPQEIGPPYVRVSSITTSHRKWPWCARWATRAWACTPVRSRRTG